MSQPGKGKLYVRIYRPPADADKVHLFESRMVALILNLPDRQNIFHSPLGREDIMTIGYFLLLIATYETAEPNLHRMAREIANDCFFEEIRADDEVKKILNESIDRGLTSYMM